MHGNEPSRGAKIDKAIEVGTILKLDTFRLIGFNWMCWETAGMKKKKKNRSCILPCKTVTDKFPIIQDEEEEILRRKEESKAAKKKNH